MIASSESRNSSKNMPRFSSNDMVHNHYLDEARKKTQERDRNSKTNVIPSARFQSTADGSKPKPRSTNHSTRSLPVSKSSCVTITAMPKADSKSSSSFSDSKHFVYSTCHKCVFNANHDACITKLLKEVNSHTKIKAHKTRNSNKPVDQKSHTQKPGRQIFTRHRFSLNKTSAVYEKTSPRSDLRWKPTGRIFKSVGLGWIPTWKLFESYTSKDDCEPTHGSNVDIPNIHESKETLDLSAGSLINVQKEQSLDLSVGTLSNVNKENLRVCQENVPQEAETVTTSNELDLLFSLMFDELLNGTTPFVSKSSIVHAVDAPNKRQQHNTTQSSTTTVAADAPPLNIQTTPQTTNQAPTQVPTVTANENIIQAETNNEYAQVDHDEFINVFSTPLEIQSLGYIGEDEYNKGKMPTKIELTMEHIIRSDSNDVFGYGGIANKNLGRNRNQMFHAGNASDESNQIVQRVPQTDSTPSKANVQCYNCNEKGHYAYDCQKPKFRDANYFREQMLLAMKDEAGSHLSNEENDFMLDNAYGKESLDELTESVMLMA
ncbi:gag-pol polyprotein [Tanacetum coccineum]